MKSVHWEYGKYASMSYKQLTDLQKKALNKASEVLQAAYQPYSKFSVGATLVDIHGEFISGVNVENAAFGSTICAERGALMHAYSRGIRHFQMLALIAKGDSYDTEIPTAPCGACRQSLYEASQVSGRDLVVVLSTTRKDKIIITDIKALLPMPFGPLDLGIDLTKWQK